MIQREMYLKRIRPFYESEMIKVLTGIRRCGKSTLLKQIYNEIKQNNIEDEQLIYINFEDYTYHKLYHADAFFEYVEERILPDKKSYLFFDEIQNVSQFELVINSFRATHDVSIFITGSNSKLLSGELASHLGGRTLSFTIMPFTFKEFCNFKEAHTDYHKLFQEYVEWGGFPLVCKDNEAENKHLILSSLYDSIVLKDIIMRNKIASPLVLDKVLEFVIGNSSLTLSGKKIANILNENEFKVSTPTVYDYLRYIEEACIVNRVQRYDIRGKKVLAFEEKIYVCDFGFFELKKNRVKDEFNLIVETAVYNELIARGYHVYIGKTYRGEVDFIAERNKEKIYIQAAYILDREETINREFNAFELIHDNYPKYVISLDTLTADREGIRHLNLIDFLLDETLIHTV